MDISLERVDEILLQHNYDGASVIAMLQEVQAEAGYLPAHVLEHLSERLGVPTARMQALSTFYRSFSLTPTGRHKVDVCMGTACHIRGGKQLLERLELELGVKTGSTTADRRYTLESVRCLGCCSIAPVVRVGDKIHGRLDQAKTVRTLKRYK